MIYYLSLGANLGEREQTINQAVSLLNSEVGQVLARFDLAMGNDMRLDAGSYKKLYAGKNNGFGQQNHWYIELFERGWFYDLVVERWNSLKEAGLFDKMLAEIDRAWEINRASFEHNFERWPIFGRRLNQEPEHVMALRSTDEHVSYLKEWLGNRILWLDEEFNS